jgi:S1-C subfamily serine protease
LTAAEQQHMKIFQEVSPSVVNITTVAYQSDIFRFNVMEVPQGTGTGFFWDTLGHVVTNFHVIKDGDSAHVAVGQKVFKAKVVGIAPEKDIAVLQIKAPPELIQPIPIGESRDLKVGQEVYAIGNPFGLDQTLTRGIVSALGREIESVIRSPIRGVIQTDAAINPGNSGGPLLDSAGRLIGVNTAIYSPSGASAGIGFAIPIDTVNWVVPELILKGKITRPSLGVSLAAESINWRLRVEGALILATEKDGAAAKAGLQGTYRLASGGIRLGDIITEIDGEKLRNGDDLIAKVLSYKVGDKVVLTVIRDRKHMKVTVTLEKMRA